jgi:hypothetical protein
MSEAGFNWVGARAECSYGPVFGRLELGCEDDAKARNKVVFGSESQARRRHFSIIENDAKTKFRVCEDSDPRSAVTFSLREDCIEIETPKKTLRITLTLNAQGECRLQVDGEQELTQWQVRKLVLEELFFGCQ